MILPQGAQPLSVTTPNGWVVSTAVDPASGLTVVSCTCPAWRFQKQEPARRTCKHIAAVLSLSTAEQALVSRQAKTPRKGSWMEPF